jgi:holo-ACP synthase CitX
MKSDSWLDKILQNREERVKKQEELLQKHNSSLLSLTINIPGVYKKNEDAHYIYERALFEIEALHVKILEKIFTCKDTGYEALFSVEMDAKELKKLTCKIEEEHPLGRFMDIDVIDMNKTILSRGRQRKCYICKANAKDCARSQKHSIEELLRYISKRVYDYKFSI